MNGWYSVTLLQVLECDITGRQCIGALWTSEGNIVGSEMSIIIDGLFKFWTLDVTPGPGQEKKNMMGASL